MNVQVVRDLEFLLRMLARLPKCESKRFCESYANLEQPGNPLGLRKVKMMNFERHGGMSKMFPSNRNYTLN